MLILRHAGVQTSRATHRSGLLCSAKANLICGYSAMQRAESFAGWEILQEAAQELRLVEAAGRRQDKPELQYQRVSTGKA